MLRKALDVVQLVALQGELTIREIGAAVHLPKSTAHRLVKNLVDVRLLEPHRNPKGDVFALGGLIKELSGGHLFWRPLIQYARPELTALRDETGETVGLHVLYSERRVLLDQVVSQHEHRWVYSNLMVPMPIYAGASAKMSLAMLPEEDMLRVVKRDLQASTGKGRAAPSLEELVRNLYQIREQRYSMSYEEVNPGVNSIAVPVVEDARSGLPLTLISLAGPSIRLTEKVLGRHLRRMQAGARAIATRIREAGRQPEAALKPRRR